MITGYGGCVRPLGYKRNRENSGTAYCVGRYLDVHFKDPPSILDEGQYFGYFGGPGHSGIRLSYQPGYHHCFIFGELLLHVAPQEQWTQGADDVDPRLKVQLKSRNQCGW